MDKLLMVGRDLLARARVENATLGSGADVLIAEPDRLVATLRESSFDLVVVDLDGIGRLGLERLKEARDEGLLPERVVGYYSHVDADLGRAAATAGVQAFPRGRFWREIRAIVADPDDPAASPPPDPPR